jgi:hypothetical protein
MGEIRKACNVLIETPKRNTQKTKEYKAGQYYMYAKVRA